MQRAPWEVSRFFGFRQVLASGAAISEGDTVNRMYFNRFLGRWLETRGTGPEYGDIPALISGGADGLYELINRLMCMGIVPLKGGGGWFGGTPRGPDDRDGPEGEPAELRGSPSLTEEMAGEYLEEPKSLQDLFDRCADSLLVDGIGPEDLLEKGAGM